MTMTRMRLRSAARGTQLSEKIRKPASDQARKPRTLRKTPGEKAAEDKDEQNYDHLHVDALDKGKPGADALMAAYQDGEGTQDGAE